MPTKTISLELDAYEKLRRMKRGRESFSSVVRRARFDQEEGTGARILEETEALYRKTKKPARQKELDALASRLADDRSHPRVSSSHWD